MIRWLAGVRVWNAMGCDEKFGRELDSHLKEVIKRKRIWRFVWRVMASCETYTQFSYAYDWARQVYGNSKNLPCSVEEARGDLAEYRDIQPPFSFLND